MAEKQKAADEKYSHSVLFPGIVMGYKSLQEAKNVIMGDCQSKQPDLKRVIFEITGAIVFPSGASILS